MVDSEKQSALVLNRIVEVRIGSYSYRRCFDLSVNGCTMVNLVLHETFV